MTIEKRWADSTGMGSRQYQYRTGRLPVIEICRYGYQHLHRGSSHYWLRHLRSIKRIMEILKTGDAPPLLVSNLEAMQLLRERIASRRLSNEKEGGGNNCAVGEDGGVGVGGGGRKNPFQNRDWIECAVLNHLESSPVGGAAVRLDDAPSLVGRLLSSSTSPRMSVTSGGVGIGVSDSVFGDDDGRDGGQRSSAGGYGLTKAETLQILNHLPTSLVEVHLMIEDLEGRERLNDEGKQLEFLGMISEFSGKPVEEGIEGVEENGSE
jgi:hypothetical protein